LIDPINLTAVRKMVWNETKKTLDPQAGLTLMELMIAMGISSFLFVVTMSLHVQTLQMFQNNEDYASLNMDSYLLNDYLRIEVMKAGGASTRGWMGLHVENDCSARSPLPHCDGSDRLSVVNVSMPEQECTITQNATANTITADFRSPGDCCMMPLAGLDGAKSFEHQQILLSLNGAFVNRYVSNLDAGTCTATLVPGQVSFADLPSGVTNYTGGIVTLVEVKSYYWNSSNNTLNVFQDLNRDAIIQPNETQVIAEQVYDFQVSLGYDFNPVDGVITETADGSEDEWLYNSLLTGERMNNGDFAVSSWGRDQLTMVALGVGIGTPRGGVNNGNLPRLFDGPVRNYPGVYVRPAIVKIAPRNTMLFQ